MTWLLALIGLVLLGLGLWGGPTPARPGPEPELPITQEEAWAILGKPIAHAETLARLGEQKQRSFRRGLLVGLGSGLILAWSVMQLLPGPAATPRATDGGGPPGAAAPGGAAPDGAAPGGAEPGGAAPGGAAPGGAEPGEAPSGEPTAPPPQPANVIFTVEPGDLAPDIAVRLKTVGLIADEESFLTRVTERGVDTLLRSGTFVIPTEASIDEVIDALTG